MRVRRLHSVTRGLGGLTMQRLWSRYQLAAAYVGGVGYYNQAGQGLEQIQELQAQQTILWKTGQFSVRDSFSYLPEGTFGYGSYGGAGGFQLGLGGVGEGMGMLGSGFGGHLGNLWALAQFGSLGQSPRITNVAVVDVVESLTPRSSVTAAGILRDRALYGQHAEPHQQPAGGRASGLQPRAQSEGPAGPDVRVTSRFSFRERLALTTSIPMWCR